VIGVGILTTSGFMARDLGNLPLILGAWIVGGILSLCGAVSYAELGAAYPRAGGEYVYLREAFGPRVGFLCGWTSVLIGFAGPVAAAAIGFAAYVSVLVPSLGAGIGATGIGIDSARILAIAVLWAVSTAHCFGLRLSGRIQTCVTFVKVAGIGLFLVLGFALGAGSPANLTSSTRPAEIGSLPAVAVALIFVMYSYSGWNASTYVAGEVQDPSRNIPRSVIGGTLVVTALFVGMNLLYFYALPVDHFAGRSSGDPGLIRIGEAAANRLFGESVAGVVTAFLAVSILACLSAMVIAGPRVCYAMARDRAFFRAFGRLHPRWGVPARAIFFQAGLATVYILTGSFEQIVTYCGFILFLFSALAVSTVFVLRRRDPSRARPYRAFGYPYLPGLFIVFCAWVTVFAVVQRPLESLAALATVLAGLVVFEVARRRGGRLTPPETSA